MFDLPKSTLFDRRIPKQKFYDNLSVTAELKKKFIDEITLIIWRNKISPATVNISVGDSVTEIEVIEIHLNQAYVDLRVLQLIDREIPYHILFLLVFNDQVQAWICYKEQNQNNIATFKVDTYFHTEWQTIHELQLRLDGLTMDSVYENFIRQIAKTRLDSNKRYELKDAIARVKQRLKLQKAITALENRLYHERQFNIQIALNEDLKRLRKELEEFDKS